VTRVKHLGFDFLRGRTLSPGRSLADRHQLDPLLRAAFGRRRQLVDVSRLPGASKKGVYRAFFADESTAIVYLWNAAEDYWASPDSAAEPDHADPFANATGLDLFEAAQSRLDELGVRTPRLYFADRSHQLYPADVAVVEDVSGPTLEGLLEAGHPQARGAVGQLGDALRVLHADQAAGFGKVLHLSRGGISAGGSCVQLVLAKAVRDLAEAAARDERIGRVSAGLAALLHRQAAALVPRSAHSLIHGELGPDHVLVDDQGRPVIIDIEGLLYFDVEWEHVFLRLRFGQDYPLLRPDAALDSGRIRLYRLAMHLSLVAGPLRLLDGDYPDRAVMLDIAEYNLGQVLALAESSGAD
jgi:hypothetical protein